MADLLTLEEAKQRLGLDPTNTMYDQELQHAIASASAAVLAYTERDFGSPAATETRTYQYEGGGVLDIDDAVEITAVELVVTGYANVALTEQQWVAQPPRRDDAPVFTYLLLPSANFPGISPEMGFERNLDVVWREGRWLSTPPTVNVTGTWGWPEVPADVKQAVLWTIEEFRATNKNESLQAEAIEGYARTWNRRNAAMAVPNRARDLLFNYVRVNV